MNSSDKQTLPGITFTGDITVNGPMFDIHDNQKVEIVTPGLGVKPKNGYSEEEIAHAVKAIMGQKGAPLDEKQKWAGVLWVLRWVAHFPADAQRFFLRIEDMKQRGLFARDMWPPCEYKSIRELATLSFLDYDPRQMEAVVVSKENKKEFTKLSEVAQALLKELG